jgi:hypothetical protein
MCNHFGLTLFGSKGSVLKIITLHMRVIVCYVEKHHELGLLQLHVITLLETVTKSKAL